MSRGRSLPRNNGAPRAVRARPESAPRRRSLYATAARLKDASLDDVIPEMLSVVGPHVDALEGVDHPLALLMSERLRRSLCRLEPLLDETLAELNALREADGAVNTCTAALRGSLDRAQRVLARAGLQAGSHGVRALADALDDEVSPHLLELIEQWETHLRALDTADARRSSNELAEALRALVGAKHAELRARLIVDDTHDVLRHVLLELTRVGRACERAFPDVARRVVPRPLDAAMEAAHHADRFNIH